ncbi:hypothetical protein PMN64_17710 [Bradyrhizobium sp. UFLA01-814]
MEGQFRTAVDPFAAKLKEACLAHGLVCLAALMSTAVLLSRALLVLKGMS